MPHPFDAKRLFSQVKPNSMFGRRAALLAVASAAIASSLYFSTLKMKKPAALDPTEFRPFKVESTTDISHDTKRIRFKLNSGQSLGLPVASCVVAKHESDPAIVRPYTPVTTEKDLGFFDLIVKKYPKGLLSNIIHSLKEGDVLEFKGPFRKLEYKPNMKKEIGMIAGGTGITPMLQIIREVVDNSSDKTRVTLLFANNTEHDILLKNELDNIAAQHSNFTVKYVLSKPSNGWNGLKGFISESMIKENMPQNNPDSLILVCGPPGMMNHVSGDKAKDKSQGELAGLLKKMGYEKENVYKF